MRSLLLVELATLILPIRALAPSTVSEIGILQLVTPTAHAKQFSEEDIASFSLDAEDFYSTYIDLDSFNYIAALGLAVGSAGANAPHLAASAHPLDTIYYEAATSLLDDPNAYLSRLKASASAFPFSSTLMSQASGILLGYESIVSQDLLHKKDIPSVTPGISIDVDGGQTTGAGATGAGATATSSGPQSTGTSKAMGIPAATGNPQLVIAAAAAAAGFFGIIAL